MHTHPAFVILAGRRHRVDRFWGTLPAGMTLGLVSTLAVAADGSLLVSQRTGPAVMIFDPSGAWRGAWKDTGIADPHGINTDGQDRVLLVDRDAHQVIVATPRGEVLLTLGERHRPRFQAPFNHPTSAFAAPDGEIYVADGYGNSAVHRFAADGVHLGSWGRPGAGPGEFSTPHSVWVDRQDRVLVVDRENNRVEGFTRAGAHLHSWGGFYHPMDICEDENGCIYVTDQTPRLSQLGPDGTLLGRCRPVWNMPHGLARSAQGVFYLTEMNPNSLTRLVPLDD